MHQLNVKSASLNGPLDEEVYAIQVSGFEIFDQEEKVLRLICKCLANDLFLREYVT